MKFTRFLGVLVGFGFLAVSAWAGDLPAVPGERIPPKLIVLENAHYEAARKEALKQRGIEIRRAPPAAPLVAEIQADGSIIYRHRAEPELEQAGRRKPQ